jgi:dolichol-phosphate mannosyltransferase
MIEKSEVQPSRPLVFVPTYNEKENAPKLFADIEALGLELDVLFMDDNSPDGTGQILEDLSKSHPHLKVVHRQGKLGVGSAHWEGIQWAYKNGYQTLITMDCDFTHTPAKILDMLKAAREGKEDIVVGSRYLQSGSLAGWHIMRRFLTTAGHFATFTLLGMPYDATGGFRLYKLSQIPRYAFDFITSKGYSFFFESLYIFHLNGFKVKEIPIALPPRTAGHSKMDFREIKRSLNLLLRIYLTTRFNRSRYVIVEPSSVKKVNSASTRA